MRGSLASAASSGVELRRARSSAAVMIGVKNCPSIAVTSACMLTTSAAVIRPLRIGGPHHVGDAAGPEPVVEEAQVGDAAARADLVEDVVVEGVAGRVVVRRHDEPGRRVDHLRQLVERQDLVRQRLVRLPVPDRKPLVAAGAVAQQVGRVAVDRAGLQVLADRRLGVGEVGDVALEVGVDEVLRADVEVLQRVAEVVDVASEVDPPERVELGGRREPGVLHRQGRARRPVDREQRPVVAARDDERLRRDRATRGHDVERVLPLRRARVDPEGLVDGHDRLEPALVHGGQPARRRRVGADLLDVRVGHVHEVRASGRTRCPGSGRG